MQSVITPIPKRPKFRYPIHLFFDQDDAQAAWEEWHCNCGPSALAAVLGLTLDEVRPLLGDFENKRYMSPTMMQSAIERAGRKVAKYELGLWKEPCVRIHRCLVRIQWTGPWTAPGANPRWAYRQTHWIAAFYVDDRLQIFDVNGGMLYFEDWEKTIVPLLVAMYPKADGGYRPTHIWRAAVKSFKPHGGGRGR